MSRSHMWSNLPLHNRVCSLPEGGILFPFDSGLHGIDSAGNIIYPLDGAVATLRPNEGRFGGAVAVEEGTTNLVYGDRTKKHKPLDTGRVTLVSPNDGLSAGTYTISFEFEIVEDEELSPPSYFLLYSNGGIGGSPSPKGKWKGKAVSTFEVSEERADSGLYLYGSVSNLEGKLYDVTFKNIQVEAKPFATSFVDGSRGGGQLNYITPLSLLNSGTVRFLVNSSRAMADHDNYSTGGLVQILHGSVRQLDGWMREQGISIVVNDSAKKYVSYEKNKWYDIAYTWENGGNPKFYFNGVLEYDDAETFTDHGSGLIRFGTYSNSYINSVLFDEITILPYAATPEQIQAWYHSNAPMHNNADTYITL